ncbi:MAG TPA: 6-bladed beta-propeller [Longimicrobiales bacterium]
MRRLFAFPALLLLLSGAATAQSPRLVPIGSFGCADCTGPALFSTIHALAITADGAIIIADDDRPLIRIFDERGTYVRGFGRTGAGPGELRLPVGVGTMARELVVVDMRNQRVTRYTTDGDVVSTHRLNGLPTLAAFPPQGGTPIIPLANFSGQELTLFRFRDDTLAAVLTVGAAEFPERPAVNFDLLGVAVAPDESFVVADGIGAYRIIRFSADGERRSMIVRDIPRARYSAEEMRQLEEQRNRDIARTRERVAAESRSAARSFTPPPIREERNFFSAGALAFDEHGRLWVRVERGPLQATTFDVFDASGRYLGEVRVQARVGRFALGAGMLAGVTLDELDLPRVMLWRVE